MTLLEKLRESLFGPDTSDNEYYGYVAQEIANGCLDGGLWARALADTEYDERKAKARYITLRVSLIKVEIAAELAAQAQSAQFRRSLDLAYEKHDYTTCVNGWSQLASQGDAEAMYGLAYIYGKGLGGYKNPYLAYYWSTCAGMKGHQSAAGLKFELIPQLMSWDIAKAEEEAATNCPGSTALARPD